MAHTSSFAPLVLTLFSNRPDVCVTIDHSTNDNGYLPCVHGKYPGDGRHTSTAVAIANLLACDASNPSVKTIAMIFGHGNLGFVVTGAGQNNPAMTSDQFITTWNHERWRPEIAKLRGLFGHLRFISCNTGAGQAGADLLFAIATVLHGHVSAYTGLTYCGERGITLQPGGVWQQAAPGVRPAPIEPPSPPKKDALMDIRLVEDSGDRRVALSDVVSVEIERTLPTRQTLRTLPAMDARGLLTLIEFDAPFAPEGVPAALETGRLIIYFAGQGNAQPERREFVIYNDLLIKDDARDDTYYYCMPAFATAMHQL